MRQLFHLSSLALVLLMSGCNTMAVTPEPAEEEAGEAAASGPATGPSSAPELTPELLYRILVAEFAAQRGHYEPSAAAFLEAARETADARMASRAARIAIYAREFGVALGASRLWVELDPASLEARQSLAALLIREGRSEEAVAHLEKLLALAETVDEQGLMMVTNLLGREQDQKLALEIMSKLIEPRQGDPEALYAYAHLAFMVGASDEALATLDQTLELRPDWEQSLALKARVLHNLGRQEEAIEAIRRAVERAPDNQTLRLGYARYLVDAKRLEEARQQFEHISKATPGNEDVIYAIGLLALQAEDLEEAEERFRQLLTAGNRKNEAAFSLGQIAEQREQWQQARTWYSSVEEGADAYLDSRIRFAVLTARQDGLDAARRYIRELAVRGPDDRLRLYLVEGELLRDAGSFADAKSVYDVAVRVFPDHPDLLYARALVSERLGRIDLLEQDLRRILDLDPNNTQALNALGYTLADRTERYDEAYAYIYRAFEQAPEDPAIMDSLGWVLYRMGKLEESLGYLRSAAEKSQDAEIAAHLGEVLWQAGHREEAEAVLKKALQRSPDDRVLNAVVERFLQ